MVNGCSWWFLVVPHGFVCCCVSWAFCSSLGLLKNIVSYWQFMVVCGSLCFLVVIGGFVWFFVVFGGSWWFIEFLSIFCGTW